ncbi:DUF1415 domain-containing protein [Vibrio sp. SM6]|uniref:DUF1415 domain-containing protein n=1 Tax=Vibrio agarilyticus TaxID=2726741 RepID=A0A7X8TQD1_9VIBR|nr:DUF1415 domain-containing protein [Vibrio agarilyticus]NLS12903.1 DUF1415 domain-containing protein [Vibrio agarilyticus]
MDKQTIIEKTNHWLDTVVIGLNLCPFAAKPRRNQQVHVVVSSATSLEALLTDLYHHCLELLEQPASAIETTLIVVPQMLSDFDEYNQSIDWVEALLHQEHWDDALQVATFHPHYCFAGNEPNDVDNLTNRAPYPIFHLIRQASLTEVLRHYPDPQAIPRNNIARLRALSAAQRQDYFAYLDDP